MNKTLWCSKRVKRTRARIWIKAQESEGDGDKFELKVTAICIQVDIFHSSTRLSPCPGPVNHFGLSHSTHTHTLIVPTPTSIRLDHSSLLLTLSQFATSLSIFNIQFKFENLCAAIFLLSLKNNISWHLHHHRLQPSHSPSNIVQAKPWSHHTCLANTNCGMSRADSTGNIDKVVECWWRWWSATAAAAAAAATMATASTLVVRKWTMVWSSIMIALGGGVPPSCRLDRLSSIFVHQQQPRAVFSLISHFSFFSSFPVYFLVSREVTILGDSLSFIARTHTHTH